MAPRCGWIVTVRAMGSTASRRRLSPPPLMKAPTAATTDASTCGNSDGESGRRGRAMFGVRTVQWLFGVFERWPLVAGDARLKEDRAVARSRPAFALFSALVRVSCCVCAPQQR